MGSNTNLAQRNRKRKQTAAVSFLLLSVTTPNIATLYHFQPHIGGCYFLTDIRKKENSCAFQFFTGAGNQWNLPR